MKNKTIEKQMQNTETNFGKKVKVRTYNGDVVERYVWRVADGYVFVCTLAVLNMLSNGEEAPDPIGFPASDVTFAE